MAGFGGADDLLDGLPANLRLQLDLVMNRSLFLKVPAFSKCTPDMICELVSRSVRQYAFPGQWIVRQGDPGIGLFMITRGVVEVSQKKEVADQGRRSGSFRGSSC